MSKRDFYEVLGVGRDASSGEIKKSYRKLALQNHPDRNPDDAAAEERFKEASEAYAVLSDDEKRALYDRYGHAGVSGSAAPNMDDIASNFGDIFADFFGFGGRPRNPNAPRQGADLEMRLQIPFEHAVHGAEMEVEVPRDVACGACEGSGAEPGSAPERCPTCGGAGRVRHSQGLFTVQTTCPRCKGRGSWISNPCNTCDGAAVVREEREVQVRIPPGVATGNRLRLRGEGQGGLNGGPAGDLYILLQVEPSEVFERDGADLHLPLTIHVSLAALGGELDIPVLDGTETIKVKPGTQHGDLLRLDGEGLPVVNRKNRRGDLYIRFLVDVPRKLNPRERELFEALAEEAGVETKGRVGVFEKIRELFAPRDST